MASNYYQAIRLCITAALLAVASLASAQIGPGTLLVREGENAFVDIAAGGSFSGGAGRHSAGGVRNYGQ